VLTYGEGPAETLFDFAAAAELQKTVPIEVLVKPEQQIVNSRSSGSWLARFELFGASFAELEVEAHRLRSRLLLAPDLSPFSK
jgi:hypothetical protein